MPDFLLTKFAQIGGTRRNVSIHIQCTNLIRSQRTKVVELFVNWCNASRLASPVHGERCKGQTPSVVTRTATSQATAKVSALARAAKRANRTTSPDKHFEISLQVYSTPRLAASGIFR